MDELSVTNSTLDFFVDFEKVARNTEAISLKLNQLNYLIGQEDLKAAVERLFEENKKCFSVLNVIIAVRNNRPLLDDDGNVVHLKDYQKSPELILEYLEKTGLAKVLKQKQIKNLVDYVFGIEVGLDTNARKNRGGTNMEKAVARIFDKNGIKYEREVVHTKFPALQNLGEDVKRFDFVVSTKTTTYLIETNYYNGGGSKLNETARAYTDLAPKINKTFGFEFVWITDGQGWHFAKNKLEEAYSHIPKVYNLKSLPDFIRILNQ